jgi:hypothetical protein
MQLHLMVDTILGINLKFFIFSNFYSMVNKNTLFCSNQTINHKTKCKSSGFTLFAHRHDCKRSFFHLKPTVNHLKPNGIVTLNQTNWCPV